jgi:hypothetical protein
LQRGFTDFRLENCFPDEDMDSLAAETDNPTSPWVRENETDDT